MIDVGGTSTDVGAVVNGFPRESAVGANLGGIRTNFRMPDVVSVAAGGGTIVAADGSLGLESVGARLTTDALVFGGETPTLSDAAVAVGRARMGDPERVLGRGWPRALGEAERRVTDAIDRMKLTRGDVPVVLVGGGSVLLPDSLSGASGILRPAHADVANAVGAAIGLVSGEAEHVADMGSSGAKGSGREVAITSCIDDARSRAAAAGQTPHGWRPCGSTRYRSPTWIDRSRGSGRRWPDRRGSGPCRSPRALEVRRGSGSGSPEFEVEGSTVSRSGQLSAHPEVATASISVDRAASPGRWGA